MVACAESSFSGMGIVSCLGNTREAVAASLREGRSGCRLLLRTTREHGDSPGHVADS